MAPLNPKDWAEAVDKIDKVSARLLVGLLLCGWFLYLGPWFKSFRTDNEAWFSPVLVLIMSILTARAMWAAGTAIYAKIRYKKALAGLSSVFGSFSPEEAVLFREAVCDGRQTIYCYRGDPAPAALKAKGMVSVEAEQDYRFPCTVSGWVWQYIQQDPDHWRQFFTERASNCKKYAPGVAVASTSRAFPPQW